MAIQFEIKEHLATLGEETKGYTKEINLISWNGREAKYDIRGWSEDHCSMTKGITLSKEEFNDLRDFIQTQ